MPQGWNQAVRTYFFGPFDIDIKDLTVLGRQVVFNTPYVGMGEKKSFVEDLTDDIKKHGLKNPIDVQWTLSKRKIDKFVVARGNSRIWAFRKLGLKKIPCYLRIYVFRDRGEIEDLQNRIFDMLKKVIPFIRMVDSEAVGTAVPIKKTNTHLIKTKEGVKWN